MRRDDGCSRRCVARTHEGERAPERRGEADRIVELRQLLPVRESHRLAEVHAQIAGDVRLRLELLHVVLVGLREHQPVDVFWIVPRRLLAMLRELDGEAMKGAGMQSLQESLDDELRAEVKPFDLVDDFGF